MKYKVVWKRKEKTYTEYLDYKGIADCLKFIEKHDDCDLVVIEPNQE